MPSRTHKHHLGCIEGGTGRLLCPWADDAEPTPATPIAAVAPKAHFTDKPVAAAGLVSYRYKGRYGIDNLKPGKPTKKLQAVGIDGAKISAETTARFYEMARWQGALFNSMINSASGADQADSYKYQLAAGIYRGLGLGEDLDTLIAKAEAQWRSYAAEQQAKVAAAPKIRRGPSSGHSAIGHRWVDPEGFWHTAHHIRAMHKQILGG